MPLAIQLTFTAAFFFNLSFGSGLPLSQSDPTTLEAIKKQLLNQPIQNIPNDVFPGFQQKKQVITAEENESLSWNALVFSQWGKTAFVAESNWQDQQTISRITIVSPKISTINGAKVGMPFDALRALVAAKIPSQPDGFLALTDRKDPTIFYFLDIRKHPELAQGVDALDDIPKPLKVEMIVVMGR